MKKEKVAMNKINKYANHLKSHTVFHKYRSCKHNINIDSLCCELENFYALNPEFYVNESNAIMKLLNDDYTNYLKWIVDDRN